MRICMGTLKRKDPSGIFDKGEGIVKKWLGMPSGQLHGVDFLNEARFEVGGFVFVDHALLGKFVNHGGHS